MKCPTCGGIGEIPSDAEYANLSIKRRAVYKYLLEAGPKGVELKDLKQALFPKAKNSVVIRTTIHCINKIIRPSRIYSYGKRVRLITNGRRLIARP